MSGSWRAALRFARREAWRSKGRTALIAAMVGVPVLLITAFIVLLRTAGDVQAEESVLLRQLGAADALVTADGRAPVVQDPLGRAAPTAAADPPAEHRPWTAQQVADAVGGRVQPVREGGTLIRTDAGAISARVREFDARDALTDGLARITAGRPPQAPDEVLVSTALADRGFEPGTTVRLVDGGDRVVVGTARNPSALKDSELIGLPGSVLGPEVRTSYLVDAADAPVSWSRVRELNALGLVVVSRAVLNDPPPDDQVPTQVRPSTTEFSAVATMLPALIIACIVLEVALLAGPAFAVGTRRQSRQHALVVATGGTPTDIRRLVLAQGIVLGFGAAVLGAALGITAVVAGRPALGSLLGHELGPPRVSPVDLVVIVGVGTFAAFAAALVPAQQATQQDTVAALAGRRGAVQTRRGWPLVGLLLMAGGLALAVVGMRASAGGELPVVLGTFALVAGVIMVTPTLLGAVGRLGAGLPLSLRLAARDTARHRSRTASVVSAIMGAVIGITAMAIASASDFAERRRDYVPREAPGSLTISFEPRVSQGPPRNAGITDSQAEGLAEQVARLLPGRTAMVLYSAGGQVASGGYENVDVLMPGCQPTDRQPCVWSWTQRDLIDHGLPVLVADPDMAARVFGRPLTAAQRGTLERGGALVPDPAILTPDGTARVRTSPGYEHVVTDLPAAVLPELAVRERDSLRLVAAAVLTRTTAERLGLTVSAQRIVVPPGSPDIGEERQARVDELVRGLVPGAYVYVERGFDESYTPVWWILAVLGGLIVLAGTVTATALAMDDARPDLATLAAVGASPWIRRRQAMAQAALVGFLGAVLGVAIGAMPGLAITWPLTAPSRGGHIVDIPWTLLGLVVVVVPLVAVVGAGLLTRSGPPMVRRIE